MHTFTRTPTDEGRDDGPLEYMRTHARELRQEGFDKGLEQGLDKGLQKGLQKGLERGAIHSRRSILTRLLSRRFSLTEDERGPIASCEDADALDAALDEIIIAETKEAVLAKLAGAPRREDGPATVKEQKDETWTGSRSHRRTKGGTMGHWSV